MLGLIPVGLVALLFVRLLQGAHLRRRRFELRMQTLEILATAARRGLPFVELMRRAAQGQARTEKRQLNALARDLEQGEELTEALHWSMPASFPPDVRATIQSAEGTAQLPAVLASLVEQTDDSMALHHRLSMAILYPVCLVLGLLLAQEAVISILSIQALFGNQVAGWFTLRGLFLSVGSWQVRWVEFASVVLLVAVVGLWVWRSRPYLRRVVEDAFARVPSLTNTGRYFAASRFFMTLSHVVAAGQALPAGIRRAAGAVGSPRLRRRVLQTAEALEEGQPAVDAWRMSGLPEFATAAVMAATGSDRAQLAESLRRTSQTCRERFVNARERMMDVLHPLVLLVIGGLLTLNFAVLMISLGGVREQSIGAIYQLW